MKGKPRNKFKGEKQSHVKRTSMGGMAMIKMEDWESLIIADPKPEIGTTARDSETGIHIANFESTENKKFMRDFWQQRHNGPITKDKADEIDEEKTIEM